MSVEPAVETIDLIESPLRAAYAAGVSRPFVAGMCGAQGSGKSTVCEALRRRLEASGFKVALLSIDDIYLPRDDRAVLAAAVHPLLRTRGVPGTHDVALGEAVIAACGGDGQIALPRFSKENDTRCPESQWTRIEAPVDIILFEGWCVGAVPQAEAALARPVNVLERDEDPDGIWRRWVNAQLASDYQRLFARLDYLVMLAAPAFEIVSTWRRQQEHGLRATLASEGGGVAKTLDDAEVERFIQHYQRITEHILAEMPSRADLVIALDRERRPIV